MNSVVFKSLDLSHGLGVPSHAHRVVPMQGEHAVSLNVPMCPSKLGGLGIETIQRMPLCSQGLAWCLLTPIGHSVNVCSTHPSITQCGFQ